MIDDYFLEASYEKGFSHLRLASYVSMVLVTMVQVVSPCWKYWLCVVMVRVTLQEARTTDVKMRVIRMIRFISKVFFS